MAPAQAEVEDAEEARKAQFFCRTCCKCFGRRYHLERHLLNTPCSGKPPGHFPCDTCGKVFPTETKLQSHARNHADDREGVKRFACGQCGRCFWSRSLLRIHSRQHTGERPFPCPDCPKGFVSLGALNKHRLCHAEERPHACPHCPARFTLKGTLNRHLPIHTGIRPHKCPHCPKEFVQAVALKSHLFSHTGQDGFCCSVCGKTFGRKTRMEEHIRTVHEKRCPQACKERGKTFSCRSELVHHKLGHDAVQNLPREQKDRGNTCTIRDEVDVNDPDTRETSESIVLRNWTVSSDIRSNDMSKSNDLSTAKKKMCHERPAEHPSCLLADVKQMCNFTGKEAARTQDTSIQENIELSPSIETQASAILVNSDLKMTGNQSLPLRTGTPDLRNCANTTVRTPSSSINLKNNKTCRKKASDILVKERFCPETSNKSRANPPKTRHLKDRRPEELHTRIEELLCVLVEKPILTKLGWPEKPVNEVLEAVIRHCGCSPSKYQFSSPSEELRENCKVLFVNVLEDDVAEKLLNNEETVEAVLGKVLELARL